jgi:hypothetical protein
MSFRNTFITDYIYQASDDTRDANKLVNEVFRNYASYLDHEVDERGFGYYAGIIKTHSLSLDDLDKDIREIVGALEEVTKVPFRLTVMQESGAVITWPVEPQ